MFSDPWTSGSPYNFPPSAGSFHGSWATLPGSQALARQGWTGKGVHYSNNYLLRDKMWMNGMTEAGSYAAHHGWPSPFFEQGPGRVYNPFDGNCVLFKAMRASEKAQEEEARRLEAERIKRQNEETTDADRLGLLQARYNILGDQVAALAMEKKGLQSEYRQAIANSDEKASQTLSIEIARLEREWRINSDLLLQMAMKIQLYRRNTMINSGSPLETLYMQ